MEDSNQQKDEDTLLRKEGWYLGELNEEAGRTVLETSGKYNVFIVHKTDDGGYILSARFPVEGTQDGVVEHLSIVEEGEGRMRIEDKLVDTVHNSLKEAVTDYTSKRDPRLSPALRKRDLEAQFSIVSIQAPPTYDVSNKQLQPDIAPLPKIDNVTTDNPVLAKTGRISPTGSLQYNRYGSYGWSGRDQADTPPGYMNNPHWYRYRDKSCCHPKNTWHCCCHRDTVWNGHREENSHSWYDCRGTGFCRCLLLILMWLLVWPFALVGLCIYFCFCLYFVCCLMDDDD